MHVTPANDVQAQLKALRLNGMAAAWADLTEQGDTTLPHPAGWWNTCCGRGCRPGHALDCPSDEVGPIPYAPRSGSSTSPSRRSTSG
jgi:hypothetical protein